MLLVLGLFVLMASWGWFAGEHDRHITGIHQGSDRYVAIEIYESGGGAAGFSYPNLAIVDLQRLELGTLDHIAGIAPTRLSDVTWSETGELRAKVGESELGDPAESRDGHRVRHVQWHDLNIVLTEDKP